MRKMRDLEKREASFRLKKGETQVKGRPKNQERLYKEKLKVLKRESLVLQFLEGFSRLKTRRPLLLIFLYPFPSSVLSKFVFIVFMGTK